MTQKTKNILFFLFVTVAVFVSVYFMYQRSFVTKDFEVFQSEEEEVIEEELSEEETYE
jgi:hypothetical protein